MRFEREVNEEAVWTHWQKVEGYPSLDFRSDIRGRLPQSLDWQLGVIDADDVANLFIISSDDWADISGGTFRVADVASRVDVPSANPDSQRIASDIKRKTQFLENGGSLDTHLIAVAHNAAGSGPFTILEGNRRSVAFHRRGTLVGTRMFVGASPEVARCLWTRHTYRIAPASL